MGFKHWVGTTCIVLLNVNFHKRNFAPDRGNGHGHKNEHIKTLFFECVAYGLKYFMVGGPVFVYHSV